MNSFASQYRFNRRTLELVTAAAVQPLDRDTIVKSYLKIDGTTEDDLLDILIAAATEDAEQFTRRAFITQTYKLTLDFAPGHKGLGHFGAGVHNVPKSFSVSGTDYANLPRAPIQSIASVVTYNEDNTAATFAASNYRLDTAGSRLVLNDDAVWPSALRERAAIEITYVAGYGDTGSDVPAPIRSAMLSHLYEMYDCRGTTDMPSSSRTMLSKYRVADGFGLTW